MIGFFVCARKPLLRWKLASKIHFLHGFHLTFVPPMVPNSAKSAFESLLAFITVGLSSRIDLQSWCLCVYLSVCFDAPLNSLQMGLNVFMRIVSDPNYC